MSGAGKRLTRFFAALMVICIANCSLYAWNPIAHYLITRAAAKQMGIHDPNHRVEDYANLPDYEDSKKWNFFDANEVGLGQQITRKFCWSHAVIDKGILDVSDTIKINSEPCKLVAPAKPTYPDDGRYPGPVMKELITKKLDLRGIDYGSDKHWDLMNTVNGFRSHNAADRIVHFDWFHGAEEEYSNEFRKEAWIAQHGLKEVWADYQILDPIWI